MSLWTANPYQDCVYIISRLCLSLLRHVITMKYLASRLETIVGPSIYARLQGLVLHLWDVLKRWFTILRRNRCSA